MEPRSRASFVILSSSLTGSDLAERIGQPGDRHWDQGVPIRPGSATLQRFSGWELASRPDRDQPAIEHLRDVVARAAGVANQVRDLVGRGDAEKATVWLHLDSPERGVSIDQSLLEEIASVGSLEIDIYS